jgi:hypothetical protein
MCPAKFEILCSPGSLTLYFLANVFELRFSGQSQGISILKACIRGILLDIILESLFL